MKEVTRVGDLPPSFKPILDNWRTVHRALTKMATSDVPEKAPIIYECSTFDEVKERTIQEDGTPQIVFDQQVQKPFAVGLAFGKRMKPESLEHPEQTPEFEWRTIVYYTEITDDEWMQWRKDWVAGRQHWMETEGAARVERAETRKANRERQEKLLEKRAKKAAKKKKTF